MREPSVAGREDEGLEESESPGPASDLSRDDLELLRGEAERLDRRRWIGAQLRFVPLVFLILWGGVLASVLSWLTSGWLSVTTSFPWAVFDAASIALLASFPVGLAGVVIARIGAARVHRFANDCRMDELPGGPRLSRGERLGAWVVAELDPRCMTLHRRPYSQAMLWAMKWSAMAVGGCFVLLGVQLATQPSPWRAVVALPLIALPIMTMVWYTRYDVVRIVDSRVERQRVFQLGLSHRLNVLDRDVVVKCYDGAVVISDRGGSIRIEDFAPGGLGAWQALRLTETLREQRDGSA